MRWQWQENGIHDGEEMHLPNGMDKTAAAFHAFLRLPFSASLFPGATHGCCLHPWSAPADPVKEEKPGVCTAVSHAFFGWLQEEAAAPACRNCRGVW